MIEKAKEKDGLHSLELAKSYLDSKVLTEIQYMQVMWEAGCGLVRESWLSFSKGEPFGYWWNPSRYKDWQSKDARLTSALEIFKFLEGQPKPPEYDLAIFEMIGLVNFAIDQPKTSQEYFNKALSLCDPGNSAHNRIQQFIEQ